MDAAAALEGRAAIEPGSERGRRVAVGAWVFALLAILTFLVVYPMAMLLVGALTDGNPIVDGFAGLHPSVKNFVTVVENPNVRDALYNSLLACAGGTALAVSWAFRHVARMRTNCEAIS